MPTKRGEGERLIDRSDQGDLVVAASRPTGSTNEPKKTMEPNKPQQKMLAKLGEIGELEDVSVRGDVVLRLAGMHLRIEETGRVRYFVSDSSDVNSGAYVGLIRLRERVAGGC